MTRHSVRTLSTVLLAAVLAGSLPSLAAEPRLPPDECVRMLRAARIAHMRGETAEELETLRAAADAFPREIAPIYALLEYHRWHPLGAEEHAELHQMLVRRLDDQERKLPAGALVRIVSDPNVEEDTLRLLAAHVAKRLEGAESEDTELLNLLATAQHTLEDYEGAATTLERLRELEPSEVVTWTLYRLYLELESWEQAADMFAELVGEETVEELKASELRGTYVRLLGKAGRLEEQERQIEIYLAENPPGPATALGLGVLMQSAWDLRDSGQDAEAERLFRRVAELDSESKGARAVLIHLYGTEAERRELATAEARRWQEESDAQTLFDQGTDLLTSGDAAGAIELLRRAAPELPELEAAWYNLGMAAYRLEDWETTASAFEHAAALNSERAESFFFRGIALTQLGTCTEAVEALQQALALDAGRTLAHYYLALCYRKLGDQEAYERHDRLYDASRE